MIAAIAKLLRRELRLFGMALQFLTRVPVPSSLAFDAASHRQAVRYFPLVGSLVGAASALTALIALRFWPSVVSATLAVAFTVWLTAAFHEDGLADTFDALLGATSREKALAIMKDSRIGTYGAAALCTCLLLRVLLLSELLARDPLVASGALVAAHGSGRAIAVVLMGTLAYAGDATRAKSGSWTGEVPRSDVAWACVIGLATLALPALAHLEPVVTFAAEVIVLVLLLWIMRNWLQRRLNGYTGDSLGATEQLAEVVVLLVFVAEWAR